MMWTAKQSRMMWFLIDSHMLFVVKFSWNNAISFNLPLSTIWIFFLSSHTNGKGLSDILKIYYKYLVFFVQYCILQINLFWNIVSCQNNDENFKMYFLVYVMMSAIILQNSNLGLHLCVEKRKREILFRGNLGLLT